MIEDPPTTRILLANLVSFALLDYIGAACTCLQVENAHDVRIKSHFVRYRRNGLENASAGTLRILAARDR